jgi:hypothetical protein
MPKAGWAGSSCPIRNSMRMMLIAGGSIGRGVVAALPEVHGPIGLERGVAHVQARGCARFRRGNTIVQFPIIIGEFRGIDVAQAYDAFDVGRQCRRFLR